MPNNCTRKSHKGELSAQRWTSAGHGVLDNEVSIMDSRGMGISCPVIAGNFILPAAATTIYDPPPFYPVSSDFCSYTH